MFSRFHYIIADHENSFHFNLRCFGAYAMCKVFFFGTKGKTFGFFYSCTFCVGLKFMAHNETVYFT